ncbi:ATP-binding protein [Novosphingobium sp. 9U]|uniref:ATP-binding protein n=1 Tax=Novosphingobium sp. 9U TaxID=2653158 RepID=UPI0012EFE3DD|nr:ATP-binding protein [Novosphingobium sp. 9U]VWX50907.1 conserved hypothetical protein [Novosphingobium sp. 9U]
MTVAALHPGSEWEQRNHAYLVAAITWIRRRMELRLAPAAPAVLPVVAPAAPARGGGFAFGHLFDRPNNPAPTALPALPPPEILTDEAQREVAEREAADALAAAATGDDPPALVALAGNLGLTPFEQDTLLLAIMRELEPALFAQPERLPSFALAMTLFDAPEWSAMSPERPLRFWQLVRPGAEEGTIARVSAPIVADERVVSFAKGLFHLDERVAPFLAPVAPEPLAALPPSQRTLAERLAPTALASGLARIDGPDRAGRRRVAAAAAEVAGLGLYRLNAEALPNDAAALAALARLWHRETLLAPVGLLAEADDASDDAPLRRFARQTGGFLVLSGRDAMALDGAAVPSLTVPVPSVAERRQAWEGALGHGNAALARKLAGNFQLGAPEIAALCAETDGEGETAIWHAARERARLQSSGLARRVESTATREDLILPDAEMAQIDALIAQVRQRDTVYEDWGYAGRLNRGLGISALFAGPSGTGKTMAAEVIADALSLDLLRIDLAMVVSKYIGETEKHLARIFDGAESAGAVMLFDEADALFGKRSDVKDSHDRYANIEIDYLLQRLEAYSGVAILTTNMRSALDPAFTRRLRFIVNFPYPAPAERERIWAGALPARTPVQDLDFARLARLDLSGGEIHAVALAAAFAAAEAGSPVTMPLLLDAARREFRKLDRPINEAEFRVLALAGARGTFTRGGSAA